MNEDPTAEILRIKARESRMRKEYEAKIADLESRLAAVGQAADGGREKAGPTEREVELEKSLLAEKKKFQPVLAEATELLELRELLDRQNPDVREALQFAGILVDTTLRFIWSCIDAQKLISFWRRVRYHAVEESSCHHDAALVELMESMIHYNTWLDIHNNMMLEILLPKPGDRLDDSEQNYWVYPQPYDKIGWFTSVNVADALLPGLKSTSGSVLVPPVVKVADN